MKQTSTDISYWLAALQLSLSKMHRWLVEHQDVKKLFSADLLQLKEFGFSEKQIAAIKNPNWRQIEKDLQWCEKNNCHIITYQDENYPLLLREISYAPLLLFVKGNVESISASQLAMVGSRNPSVTGSELAEQFAYYLSQAGLVITSGLALGIDAASHRGALNATGKTVAVCGAGLDQIYPASHRKLAAEIMENGSVISEFSPYTLPRAKFFPLRNRIISGLSLGVLVVEAALRSGSLITARNAVEQGREVFAIPGSIHNPLARGCHQLLRQGAKLVETAEDILEELGALNTVVNKGSLKLPQLTESLMKVLEKIGYEITALDAIILRSGLTREEVSSMLLSLELAGYVSVMPGGYIRKGIPMAKKL